MPAPLMIRSRVCGVASAAHPILLDMAAQAGSSCCTSFQSCASLDWHIRNADGQCCSTLLHINMLLQMTKISAIGLDCFLLLGHLPALPMIQFCPALLEVGSSLADIGRKADARCLQLPEKSQMQHINLIGDFYSRLEARIDLCKIFPLTVRYQIA